MWKIWTKKMWTAILLLIIKWRGLVTKIVNSNSNTLALTEVKTAMLKLMSMKKANTLSLMAFLTL